MRLGQTSARTRAIACCNWLADGMREHAPALAVAALVLFNSAAYLTVSENLLGGTGGWTVTVSQTRSAIAADGFLAWAQTQNYYPPLYLSWLSLVEPGPAWRSPVPLVLWSDLLMVAGLLGMASALLARGANRVQLVAATLLLAGCPLFNAFTKLLTYECGMLGAAGLLLAVLARPGAMASLRLAALAGAVTAAGLLFKWTFFLFAAGPVAVAALGAWRLAGIRRALGGLTAYAGAAIALAGPWFAFCLDWHRVRETAANDATFPGLGGWELYRAAASRYLTDCWPASLGDWLLPIILAGVALALVTRRPGSGLLLSSALLPALVLPAMTHVEGRYLLPALPGLAGAAGLGVGSLSRKVRLALLAAAACASLLETAEATWLWWTPAHRELQLPQGAFDDGYRMTFHSTASAERLLSDTALWANAFDTPEAELALHPLNPHPMMQLEALRYLRVIRGKRPDPFALFGYDWSEYVPFVQGLRADRFAFLAVPQGIFLIPPAEVRSLTEGAWSYIHQIEGAAPRSRDARAPDDGLLMELISRKFLALERIQDPAGDLWLLVSRRHWESVRQKRPGLPVLEPFTGPTARPLLFVPSGR